MLRKILALISLVGLITIGLIFYSLTISVSEMEQTATSYQKSFKQRVVEKTKEVTAPVLSKFGVNVETAEVEDLNIVKQKLEEASAAVDEATKKIGNSN